MVAIEWLTTGAVGTAQAALEAAGVVVAHIPVADTAARDALCEKRGYKFFDEGFLSKEAQVPSEIDIILETMEKEHWVPFDAPHYILDGGLVLDVKLEGGNWVRVTADVVGDLVILPPNTHHRFRLGQANFVKMLGMYADNPADATSDPTCFAE
eukprot:gnl/Hemi2/18475_TR6112_c0_g12_i1.p1 gnl/Hemi2/18475_TR6112_c0_g12~~gnl/Hemi2/18475_TR6112_c0_g12_i1.p1  ORF type:complete len:154 (-),score=39.08 gnl/Hemi2/18475_TR6112_c0_g12_i1:40-501(-)